MVTNRNYCTVFTVSDSDDWSFDRIIPAMDAALRWIKESTEIQPFIPSEAPRVIYSYGPIGNNDHEIRIDAIYEFLAALKMVEMTLVSAADFFAKTIKDKRSAWDYLDKNKISNLRLQKELKKSGLTVELETLKKARSRRRQERSRAKAPTT